MLAMMREHSTSVMRARGVAALLMDDLEDTIRNRERRSRRKSTRNARDDENGMRKIQSEAWRYRCPPIPEILADLSGALKTLISLSGKCSTSDMAMMKARAKASRTYVMSLPAVN
ncbi:MAG: hypothetical protein U5N53_22940 [Mycobacterium sp.]|nr:hypothetical protein [Mycobacterium sp.]